MKILETWRQSKEVIEQESDERVKLASSTALSRVAAVTLPFAVVAIAVLVIAPLSPPQREFGLVLLVPAILLVAAITLRASLHRSRAHSARLQRALLVRSVWGYPVAAVVVGLVDLAWRGDPSEAATFAAAILIGGLIGSVIHYWRLSLRS